MAFVVCTYGWLLGSGRLCLFASGRNRTRVPSLCLSLSRRVGELPCSWINRQGGEWSGQSPGDRGSCGGGGLIIPSTVLVRDDEDEAEEEEEDVGGKLASERHGGVDGDSSGGE